MTVRTAELLMGIATLLLSLGFMWSIWSDDLRIGWVEGRGPGAGVWPFWLSFGMALASLATIWRWVQGKTAESRNTEPYVDSDTMFLVIVSALSVLALIIMMQTIGTYLALFFYMLFYVRFLGKHSWRTTLAFAFGTPVFVYFLFEVALTKYLPKGWPIFENGFLWIDNYRWIYLGG